MLPMRCLSQRPRWSSCTLACGWPGDMERDTAIEILDRLHSAQNEFYAGGSGAMLKKLLTADISWKVPGNNRIAGTYRGLEEVFGYFRRRRDLADQSLQMIRRDVLVGTGLQ